jgi:hypothetical protein
MEEAYEHYNTRPKLAPICDIYGNVIEGIIPDPTPEPIHYTVPDYSPDAEPYVAEAEKHTYTTDANGNLCHYPIQSNIDPSMFPNGQIPDEIREPTEDELIEYYCKIPKGTPAEIPNYVLDPQKGDYRIGLYKKYGKHWNVSASCPDDPTPFQKKIWETKVYIKRKTYELIDKFNEWIPWLLGKVNAFATIMNIGHIAFTYNFDQLIRSSEIKQQMIFFISQLALREFIIHYSGNPTDYLPPEGETKLVMLIHNDKVWFKHMPIPEEVLEDSQEITVGPDCACAKFVE